MGIEEIEAEALKLNPEARARLAGKLLESLDELSASENDDVWAAEAGRRDADMDARPETARPSSQALRDAHTRLK